MSGFGSTLLTATPQPSFQAMKLSDLLGHIKRVLNNAVGGTYWITAEVSNISQSPHNGHVYFDLVESQGGIKKAFIRGNLWASRASQVLPHFYQVTGGYISIGMELMLLVKVEMHPQYGLSLTIFDINPEYTLGHLERLRQETISRLQAEGIWDLNRQRYLPLLLQRVAVITSSTAAGWGDFQKQIAQNPIGKLLKLTLFSSMMQGDKTTKSIADALDAIAQNLSDYDAVVIIRGGGSKMDLSAFDDYHLCCLIANFPIPIITGIGHEKDISVADMVAHTAQKTPTAVAEFLLRRLEQIVLQLLNAEARLDMILSQLQQKMLQEVGTLSQQSLIVLGQIEASFRLKILSLQQKVEQLLALRLNKESHYIEQLENRLKHRAELSQAKCSESRQAISYLSHRLTQYLTELPTKLAEHINKYEQLARLYDPQNIMKRGFLPVLKGDKPILSLDDVVPNERLKVLLLDGELTTTIESIRSNHDE